MASIPGSIRILHIRRTGGDWRRVAHLTVNSWESVSEFLSTTTRKNAGFKTQRPISQSDTIGFSAIVFEDADIVGKLGYKELRAVKTNRELIDWKLEALGKGLTDTGKGHIASISESAPFGESMIYEGSIQVYGKALDVESLPAPGRPFLNPVTQQPTRLEVDLDWEYRGDDSILHGYEIRRSDGRSNQTVSIPNRTTRYSDRSVRTGVDYSYSVRTVDVTGKTGDWSTLRTVNLTALPGQPEPNYKTYQNGELKLYQDGTPKIYQ